jgi:hypothetical protein
MREGGGDDSRRENAAQLELDKIRSNRTFWAKRAGCYRFFLGFGFSSSANAF